MNYVMSVSETHNLPMSAARRTESIEDFRGIVETRNEHAPGVKIGIGVATALGCTMEGGARGEAAEDAGAGAGRRRRRGDAPRHRRLRPAGAGALAVRKGHGDLAGDVPVGSHFHDTRGLGLANVLAPLEAGCTRFDASLAGLGGCPFAPGATGNIVIEDLVFLLESEGLRTGIDIEALRAAREMVEAALPDEPKYGQVLRAGLPKGFAPASGRRE